MVPVRKDRISIGVMRNQRDVEPKGGDVPVTLRNVSGRWSKASAGNLEHMGQ